MSVYSKFLELQSGAARTIDLSTNTLSVQGLQINAATGGGFITQAAHSTTTTYSIVWPAAQAAGSSYALFNDGAGNLSWASAASGANTALSNLAVVAINTSLLPGADNSINLGSASFSWASANIHTLKDGSSNTSIDTYGRLLKASDGTTTQLDWSTAGTVKVSGSPIELVASYTSNEQGSPGTFIGNNSDLDTTNKFVLFGSTDSSLATTSSVGIIAGSLLGTTLSPGNQPGAVSIVAGSVVNDTSGSGIQGGGVSISGGNGVDGSGGGVAVVAGNSSGAGAGGTAQISAGNSSTGAGGNVQITAGSGATQGSVFLGNAQYGSTVFVDPSGNLNLGTTGSFGGGGAVLLYSLTAGGVLTFNRYASSNSYSLSWPTAQASGIQVLQNNGSGVLSWVSGATGSVTSVSVVSANGFAGTVATATSTPAITLSTTVTGILQGNGTAISAASTTGSGNVVLSASPTLTGTLTAAAASFSAAVNMNNNQVNNLATPTASTDAATKGYVDAAINGLTWKGPVEAYAASNVPLTGGATLTIDGYSVQNGDLVILGNQTTASQNGEYTASGIGTAYTLTANGQPTAAGDAWLVLNGTTYANSAFVATAAVPSAAFVEFAGPTALTYTAPLMLSGNTVSITQATTSTNGYLSSTDWNTFNNKQPAGSYITALTGDATASGPGSAALTLATVNSNTGSFGSSTSIPSFTVNAKGLITAASGNAVVAPAGTLSGTTLNSTVVSSSLTSVGTIATGVWNGTAISNVYGGTGVNSSSSTGVAHVTSGTWTFSSVVASDLGTVTDGITTDQSGAGSTIEVLNAPALKRTLIAGQTFTANTSYAVRWGITANSETAGRVYAADITTSSFDLFYVIGMASSAAGVSAGGSIVVTTMGPFALSSADTAFASGTDGEAVFLTASGTFSVTSPSSSGQAVTRVGMVQVRSATVTSNIIDVWPQVVGIN